MRSQRGRHAITANSSFWRGSVTATEGCRSHTTDRMREHYSTVGTDETCGMGARLVPLVPAVATAVVR